MRGSPGSLRGVSERATPDGYLDAASSEALHPAARRMLLSALEQGYADPRRLHGAGRSARLLLDNAREVIADALGVRPDEVTFTASGTEAVHRGLLGLHRGRAREGRSLLVSAVEHSAVFHAARWTGDPVTTLPVDVLGRVDVGVLVDLAAPPTRGPR